MCGIAGFAGSAFDAAQSDARLRTMCDAIEHRGPDDEGRYVPAPGTAIGMRRLSIIDVSGGHQPIHNETGDVAIVFNGEIYNHHELRVELERRGHRFVTRSDTETLVHLYEEHGPGMLPLVRGMFAFAIWDARQQRLFIARDRLGIKPLYFWQMPRGGLAFGSELRSFLALGDFPRQIDRAAMAGYLAFGYVPDPECIFSAVRKLPPGHWLSWTRARGVEVTRYWNPVRPEQAYADEGEAIEELRRLLALAVESHLESEVPLGAFLSGGIDSSTVVALMARAMDRKVQTFSIGFDEPEYNEAPHASSVAASIGTDHTSLILRPEADAVVEAVIQGFDEPFGDASALPTLLVSYLARQKVTVALSGDGGDELFGGYTRYAEVQRGRSLPIPVLRQLVHHAARRLPQGAVGRNWLLNVARSPRGRYASTVAWPLAPAEGGAARAALLKGAPPFDKCLDRWFDQAAGRDFSTQLTIVDLLTYLPGDILTKVDRMSMKVSLEARVPLLDHRLVEFAVSLPSRFKMQSGTGKWILRQAIRELVPPQVLSHQKQGFAVPLDTWFRGPLRHRIEALQRADAPLNEWVEPGAVERIAREHLTGRRNHQDVVWRLVVLDGWLRALARGDIARTSRSHGDFAALSGHAEFQRAVG